MAQTLQINIDNHRYHYQLVSSMTDGLYLVKINSQRRLMILLSVLLFLLAGYLLLSFTHFHFNSRDTDSAEVYQPVSAEPAAPVVREKHINPDTRIPADSYQHAVYLYYDRYNVLETFLPVRSEAQ